VAGNRGDTVAKGRSGPTELPPQFGRYRVKKKLGGGGMGTVYLVENTELEREEALKVPHFSDGDDPQLRERFLREAKSAAKLDHANLCPIYDAGVQDGIYYLTMRFLKGKLLSDYTGSAQPDRKAVEIVTKLAQALEAAHSKGVIHRDLKPSNVMMVGGAGPVVMDFGLAKQVRQADQTLTQAGSMLGTPAYMPPEQVNGDLERMGPASDVYSLGVILYELLTGRLPFEGTTAAIFGQILYLEPPLPSALVPGLNPVLDGICRKAMAKVSTDRYPSMKAFAAALLDYLRSTPATEGAGNLVPTAVDNAAVYQLATVPPGRQPAGNSDVFQAATVPPQARRSLSPTLRGAQAASGIRPPNSRQKNPRTVPKDDEEKSDRNLHFVAFTMGCALLAIAYGLWAAGVIRLRTADGILVVEVNEPNPDVYVDGQQVTVTWDSGGHKAEIAVKPGTHQVEVKKGGFTAAGETVTLEDHGRTVLAARLEPLESTPNLVSPASPPSDPFEVNSVWVGDSPRKVLTVIARKGEKFTAKFEIADDMIEREVTGTINDGTLSWLAKDVRAIRGRVGGDNHGTIRSDESGDEIDFVWRDDNGASGTFILRLSKTPPQLSPPSDPSTLVVGRAASGQQVTPRASKPKSPGELAAIRNADIDRGQSVRASTDPAEIAEIVGEVAPGFTARLPVIPGGVALVAEHFGRTRVLSTHPLDPVNPCILTSTIDVPANKKTSLTFDVSHSPVGDWQVIVLANGERLFDAPVGSTTARNGWLAVSVDLTRFAGQQVVLELQNKATGYSHEWGWWDKVRITAR
jgi:serine/threonine protein kinase